MAEYELKTWGNYFEDLLRGVKSFEYRKNDRNFKPGDTLWLREWNNCREPFEKNYSGRNIRALVQGVWVDIPGMPPEYCIMQIKIYEYWDMGQTNK